MIIPILTTSLIHFSLGRLGECTRGKMKGEILTLLIKFHYSLEKCLCKVNVGLLQEAAVFWSRTERGMKAELRLQQHPYDTESWGVLTREAQVLGSLLLVLLNCCTASEAAVHVSYTGKILIHLTVCNLRSQCLVCLQP